ncbi:MAG: repressor LexA [Candidatus Hydrogenedentota bacterium]|nr:MAG: repressor LexA [Candidatus Hydrogenedentota bacterium]
MAKGLTQRQGDILGFIIESIRDDGYPPTIAEIGTNFGINSTNGVNDHLIALEKKGYIERSSKARGIRISTKAAAGLYQEQQAGMVPLLGHVAAGSPILAEENIEDYTPVDKSMAREDIYSLRVHGESMIEAGILDGDVIIVDQARKARRGDIIVALLEGDATAKYYYPQGDMVELRPANAAMESIMASASELDVQGVVVGLQRSY